MESGYCSRRSPTSRTTLSYAPESQHRHHAVRRKSELTHSLTLSDLKLISSGGWLGQLVCRSKRGQERFVQSSSRLARTHSVRRTYMMIHVYIVSCLLLAVAATTRKRYGTKYPTTLEHGTINPALFSFCSEFCLVLSRSTFISNHQTTTRGSKRTEGNGNEDLELHLKSPLFVADNFQSISYFRVFATSQSQSHAGFLTRLIYQSRTGNRLMRMRLRRCLSAGIGSLAENSKVSRPRTRQVGSI